MQRLSAKHLRRRHDVGKERPQHVGEYPGHDSFQQLCALVKSASQTLGMMAMARDLGLDLCGRISSDASVALGVIQCQELGMRRHIATQFLWIQEKVTMNWTS